MWIQEGYDTDWCNLVVPSPMGLVCTYAMGSESEMPPESCQLACEICAWWPCVYSGIHALVAHCQTPPTTIQARIRGHKLQYWSSSSSTYLSHVNQMCVCKVA